MDTIKPAAKGQRVAVGAAPGVLLAIGSPALLARMAEAARAIEGLRVVGAFGSVPQAIDWLVWERRPWHFAFVDLGLRDGDALLQRLLAHPCAGRVVALGDAAAGDRSARCAALGASDLLEAGDLSAFRGYLEARVH